MKLYPYQYLERIFLLFQKMNNITLCTPKLYLNRNNRILKKSVSVTQMLLQKFKQRIIVYCHSLNHVQIIVQLWRIKKPSRFNRNKTYVLLNSPTNNKNNMKFRIVNSSKDFVSKYYLTVCTVLIVLEPVAPNFIVDKVLAGNSYESLLEQLI